jgi:hypothetical protein
VGNGVFQVLRRGIRDHDVPDHGLAALARIDGDCYPVAQIPVEQFDYDVMQTIPTLPFAVWKLAGG